MAPHALPGIGGKVGKGDKDRRRSQRRPHVVTAWICSPTAGDGAERTEVTSMNLSRHGVAFTLPRELPPGCYYVMEVGFGDQRMTSEIRTISCDKAEDGQFRVGAEFC